MENRDTHYNMVRSAADNKPGEFADHFKTAIAEKIIDKLSAMRSTISKNFFNSAE